MIARRNPSPARLAAMGRRVLPLLLVAALVSTTGCTAFNYIWYVFGGVDKQKSIEIKSEYKGLAGKSTAVLVAADEYLYYEYPGVPLAVCRSVSAKLHEQVKGIKLTNPAEVDQFQQDNPYWNTLPPGELLQKLKVDRVVYVDLSDFGLHEQGNAEIWRGKIDANVSVAEKEAKNPDQFVFTKRVFTQFPPDNPVGLLDSDDQVIQLGLLRQFSLYVSGLFNEEGATVPK